MDGAFWRRSMSDLSRDTMEDIYELAESLYTLVQATKSGAAFKAVPNLNLALLSRLLLIQRYPRTSLG
jgi:hypothetical protein